jgi:hypothetical protein
MANQHERKRHVHDSPCAIPEPGPTERAIAPDCNQKVHSIAQADALQAPQNELNCNLTTATCQHAELCKKLEQQQRL